jgi:hypothetical protein
MDPLLDQIIRLAYGAIRDMEVWMRKVVRGFEGLTVDDRRSDANVLGYCLFSGKCDCGLANCQSQHDLDAYSTSEVELLSKFVRQAVIGPIDDDPKANSVAQGMYYRLILNPERGMLVALVELKRCANPACRKAYEGARCPEEGCGSMTAI